MSLVLKVKFRFSQKVLCLQRVRNEVCRVNIRFHSGSGPGVAAVDPDAPAMSATVQGAAPVDPAAGAVVSASVAPPPIDPDTPAMSVPMDETAPVEPAATAVVSASVTPLLVDPDTPAMSASVEETVSVDAATAPGSECVYSDFFDVSPFFRRLIRLNIVYQQ